MTLFSVTSLTGREEAHFQDAVRSTPRLGCSEGAPGSTQQEAGFAAQTLCEKLRFLRQCGPGTKVAQVVGRDLRC